MMSNEAMPFDDFFRGRRVLVTGDTGFKGSWLAMWLKHLGAEVSGLALPPDTDPSNYRILRLDQEIEHHDVDLRELDAVRKTVAALRPEIVFHLAAQAIVRVSYEQPIETLAANFMGTAHLLQAVREAGYSSERPCVVVCITSDKCYANRETYRAYRESDPMGGYDVYSMSKGTAELLISSWRQSFFNPAAWRDHGISLASVRAGNVIGGGDWAPDRVVVDSIRALAAGEPIGVRNPSSIRPWQHVMEPLSGYLRLGAALGLAAGGRADLMSAYNFGPGRDSERTVKELVEAVVEHWGSGGWESTSKESFSGVHEAVYLKLATDKAWHLLRWKPAWGFDISVKGTVEWYRRAYEGGFDRTEMTRLTLGQIDSYTAAAAGQGLRWAGRV
jgi:CDP-glucose 4,6-dehydratase